MRAALRQQPSVVVTGVSSGIGLGITKVLTAHGIRVFGSVRTHEDADRIQKAIPDRFVPLLFDVTDAAAVKVGSAHVRKMLDGEPLLGLVNNAGAGSAGPLLHLPLEEFRRQLEVNLVAPLSVSQHFASLLEPTETIPGGRIVNIGSTAGSIGLPFFGAYTASKHGLNGLSESLRRELLICGIDVITVVPGPVKSAIWDKAEALDLSAYSSTRYRSRVQQFLASMICEGRKGLEPEEIGSAVLAALTEERPRHVYVVVAGRFKNWTLPRILPARITDKLIARRFGLT